MRGHDVSSRYPPRGVWFGLILVAGTVRAVLAQDLRDEAEGRRHSDPVVLAATSVTQWKSSDGVWVRLVGNTSVLQGVDGVRAGRPSFALSTSRPKPRRSRASTSMPKGRSSFREPAMRPRGRIAAS